jgi:hypothetical protein
MTMFRPTATSANAATLNMTPPKSMLLVVMIGGLSSGKA